MRSWGARQPHISVQLRSVWRVLLNVSMRWRTGRPRTHSERARALSRAPAWIKRLASWTDTVVHCEHLQVSCFCWPCASRQAPAAVGSLALTCGAHADALPGGHAAGAVRQLPAVVPHGLPHPRLGRPARRRVDLPQGAPFGRVPSCSELPALAPHGLPHPRLGRPARCRVDLPQGSADLIRRAARANPKPCSLNPLHTACLLPA